MASVLRRDSSFMAAAAMAAVVASETGRRVVRSVRSAKMKMSMAAATPAIPNHGWRPKTTPR
jgi:hypothetical protein